MKDNALIASVLSLLGLIYLFCFGSSLFASPFCPVEWQQEIVSGPLAGQKKHINWVRDIDGDFVDDAFNSDCLPGDKTTVIVELSECMGHEEAVKQFSSYGTVVYTGTIVAFVIMEDVLCEKLLDLANLSNVAGLEKPQRFEKVNDTSTRVIRQRASNTYSLNTFADAFPAYDGTGVNIAIADSGVDDVVHAAFAGKYVAGYNAQTDTVGNPDCDDETPYIATGADGICNTTATGDDTQDVAVGQTPPDQPCVSEGPNGVLDSSPGGDDFIGAYNWGTCSSENIIATGTNGICNTTAVGDDYQLVPVGARPSDAYCIGSGTNGTIDTTTSGDDTSNVVYHGTHVAGIALGLGVGPSCRNADDGSVPNNCAGVAPGAGLIDVKVLDDQGSCWDTDIIRGFDWIFLNGQADVINLSVGNTTPSDGTSTLSKVINALVANDIPVVVASGNSWGNCIGSTAAASLAITVASSNDMGTVDRGDDRFSKFSTFGPRADFDPLAPDVGMLKPDITAPGSDICSVKGEDGNTADSYHELGGTSMAAPHVSGAVALLIDMKADIPAGAIKDLLKRTAFQTAQHTSAGASYPSVDPVYNVNWGYGLLDLYQAGILLDAGITDMSFTDCVGTHPDYPDCRRCLLGSSSYSYDNFVDIQLATDPPIQGVPNTISVTVENRGLSAAENVVVSVGVIDFGVGVQEFYDVASQEISSIGSGASPTLTIPWTPTASSHQCIQASIDYGFDTDYTNNLTQLNVNPVSSSSPASAHFRVANPLNEEAKLILNLELDENASKMFEVNIEGISLQEPITMRPGDCPILCEAQFFPNGQFPPGSKAKVYVTGKAFSKNHPEGFELSGVAFALEVVDPGLKYAWSIGNHKEAGMLKIPLNLNEERPTSEPRAHVNMLEINFNVPMGPPQEIPLKECIVISAANGSKIPEWTASFEDQAIFGTVLFIQFRDDLPNKERYQLDFKRLVDQDGDPLTGDGSFDFRVLQGDCNGNGNVTATDISFARGRINSPVKFGPTSRADVNQSGTLTATDISFIRGRIGSQAP